MRSERVNVYGGCGWLVARGACRDAAPATRAPAAALGAVRDALVDAFLEGAPAATAALTRRFRRTDRSGPPQAVIDPPNEILAGREDGRPAQYVDPNAEGCPAWADPSAAQDKRP